MKKLLAVISALLISIFALSGCNGYESLFTTFYSMDAEATLVLTENFTEARKQDYKDLCDEISRVLYSFNSSLSVGTDSYVTKFNGAQAGTVVEIDETAYEVLQIAKNVYTLTDGYYNPAVYYSVQAYGFLGTAYPETADKLPSDETTEAFRRLSSHFGEIELSEEGGRYYVKKPEAVEIIDGVAYSMKIDLGGIGKGYAIQKVEELLDEYAFYYGYFDFGSSSMLLRKHHKNTVYALNLTAPRSEIYGTSYLKCEVSDVCLSSSGDDVQFYEIDGVRYCHIIDPTTGKPVQTGVMTATVIGGNAAESDALTTAIMAMGKEMAVEFINEKLSDRKVAFTYNSGGKYEVITNMAESEYTITDENYTVVSTVKDGKIILGAQDVA